MAHDPAVRAKARLAYLSGLSMEEAADKAGVSVNTVRRWRGAAEKGGDDWDRARAANRLAGQGRDGVVREILEAFLLAHQRAIEQVRDDAGMDPVARTEALASLSTALSKTMAALTRATPTLTRLGVAMELLNRLARFVDERFPRHRSALVEILEPFGAEIIREEEA